jgi:O-antigen ligase
MGIAVAMAGALAVASGAIAGSASPVVPAAVLMGVVAAVGALRYPTVAVGLVLGVIALLPFGVIPVRLGVAPTFLDLATAVLWATWIGRVVTGRDRVRHPAIFGTFGLYVAVSTLAYVGSPDPIAPNETARAFAKAMVASLAVVPVAHLATNRMAGTLITGILFGTVAIEALVGLVLYAIPRAMAYRALTSLAPLGYPTGDSVIRYRPDTDILRAIGTSIDPNMLGVLLMVAGSIGIAALLAPRPPWPRIASAAALAPILLCLLLTESRGSWLSLGAAVGVITVLRHRRLWIVALIGTIAIPFVPSAQRFTEHLISGLQAQDRAASMRLGEISNALTIIWSAPWVGVGWGLGDRSIDLEFTRGVSNIYLAVAQRSGIPALVVYLTAWATTAVVIWKGLAGTLRDPLDNGVSLGCVSAVAGALASGMVDHHFVSFPHLVSLLAIVAGVLIARTAVYQNDPLTVAT